MPFISPEKMAIDTPEFRTLNTQKKSAELYNGNLGLRP